MSKPFTFAFLTDPQLGMNSPSGLDAPDSDKARLCAAVGMINESDAEFVILGGDQIHGGYDVLEDEQAVEEQPDAVESALSGLNVPYYSVPGNHDFGRETDPRPYTDRGFPMRFTMQHKGVAFVEFSAVFLKGDHGRDRQEEEWSALRQAFAEIPADCTQTVRGDALASLRVIP